MDRVGVGVVGFGTVGEGVVRLLLEDGELLADRTGLQFELRHVIDVDLDRPRQVSVPSGLLGSDVKRLLADDETRIAVELVGGTTVARQIVSACLAAGKDVVTANKALLATHGQSLYTEARGLGRCIAFEASCGGGIPLVESIRRGLAANRIEAIYGIVNGTCNYVLTEMLNEGKGYGEALGEAKEHGYAEADPTLDVSGGDSAHKLAILASLAFGVDVDLERITVEGIDKLELTDLQAGAELGYVCKLLAIGQRREDGICLRVRPTFIHHDHPLASVSGPFNAVSVYGHATGHTLYYGRGAGQMPTASAVVADVVDTALGNAGRTFAQMRLLGNHTGEPTYMPVQDNVSRHYVRLMVRDEPGVMAKVSKIFGEHRISLSAIVQHEIPEELADKGIVPVVIMTHRAREGDVDDALGQIAELDVVLQPPACIRVLEEQEEF